MQCHLVGTIEVEETVCLKIDHLNTDSFPPPRSHKIGN